LRELGARVTEAESIAEAERALAHEKFELVLSDVHLPGNEALQWTERLIQAPAAPPVLLMTGNPEIVTAMRAANLPVAGYLAKPTPFPIIAAMVRRLLAVQRQRVALHTLAAEVRALLASTTDVPADTAQRLETLAASLTAEAMRVPRDSERSDETSRQAIRDTIAVLEKTRQNFRSKELGRLRRRLEQVLVQGTTTGGAADGIVRKSPCPSLG
jgi:DNA-binding response OmpR family regulator